MEAFYPVKKDFFAPWAIPMLAPRVIQVFP
jgi:hypothetical protein